MTLSHCWGSAEFFKLTADTSSELADGIPLDLLPKTFQDAISIVWRLGAKYLWIDSLCIFKDLMSMSDWEREATTMSVVSAGSFCNIVASASSSSHGGCFRGRDPRIVKPSVIEVRYTDRPVSKIYIRYDHIFAGSDRGNGGWFRAPDINFPLFKRGCECSRLSCPYHTLLEDIWFYFVLLDGTIMASFNVRPSFISAIQGKLVANLPS